MGRSRLLDSIAVCHYGIIVAQTRVSVNPEYARVSKRLHVQRSAKKAVQDVTGDVAEPGLTSVVLLDQ